MSASPGLRLGLIGLRVEFRIKLFQVCDMVYSPVFCGLSHVALLHLVSKRRKTVIPQLKLFVRLEEHMTSGHYKFAAKALQECNFRVLEIP